MSGGVDSSVAAALLKDEGFDVTGIMLKLWEGPAANNESGCCSLDAAEDARRVAQVLDIPFYVFNFAEHFRRSVVERFIEDHQKGRTPNPCVECNRSVKFSALLERARAIGAEVLATGHYARVVSAGTSRRLLRGKDRTKDQSYVLYMLDQSELQMASFPVGEYSKTEIRQIAGSLDLRTAHKAESQEICFVPSGDSHAFVTENIPAGSKSGSIIDQQGNRLGTHRGFAHYTVGQRRGLGVSVGLPLYVRSVDARSNIVTVATGEHMTMESMIVEDVSFVAQDQHPPDGASVMTRYRGPEAEASLVPDSQGLRVQFTELQPCAAPGQAAVFYRDEDVLGGGTVVSTN